MEINISQIVNMPGESVPFEFVCAWSDIAREDDDASFAGAVSAYGSAVSMGDGVFEVNARIKGRMETECARCLKPVVEPVECEVTERYSKESTPEDDFYAYSNDVLRIDELVRDNLILSAPARVLCDSACKGLCPNCGQDLNNNPHCSCGEAAGSDSPFSALSALLNDDDEEV